MSAAGRPVLWEPCRLWSLWDMLEINAHQFHRLTVRLTDIAAWVSAHEEREGSIFHRATPLQDVDRQFLEGAFKDLSVHLEAIGAPIAAMAALDAESSIKRAYATWGTVKDGADDVRRTASRELTKVTLLSLSPQERKYYDSSDPPFGEEFSNKFQSAGLFELDEAAKCLALGRSTAAVFHLMRLMEIGIRAISDCLGMPAPAKPAEKNWGTILRKIWDDGIARKWPTAKDRMAGDGAVFEGLHASLDAVKAPWRDATMHVEKKYTPQEAEHIFMAVKGFMMALSSRCDEEGNPRA
jgi:hypothetical protein